MRPSNKSRNRNKNNNRRGSAGNNINRVFESSGPDGRVRGTPQQIIDKYISLTHDAQLSGDRVAAENFQQHAEHYSRLLNEAQKELVDKQVEQKSQSSTSRISNNGGEYEKEETGRPLSDESNSQEQKVVELSSKTITDKKPENKETTTLEKRKVSGRSVKKRIQESSETIEI